MQAFKTFFTGTLLLGTLAGCSYLTGDDGYFRDRQGDYLTAPTIEPMEIPQELDSYTLDALYVVPEAIPDERPFFITAPTPRGLDTNIREGVVVQRFGERRWIVIGAEPGQVWPRMRDYWSTAQIRLDFEDPVRAIMETVWLGEEGARNKYRVRIEPGLHAGNSEVYVVQINESYVEEPEAPIQWPENSVSLELENAMLDDISLYLADRTDLYRASSVSLLAGSIEAESKANIVPTANGDTLEVRIDFGRAWSQLSQALENAEIEVTQSNRDEAYYTVRFDGSEEEERPGFFRRMFGAGRDKDEELPVFTITIDTLEDRVVITAEPAAGDAAATAELRNQLIRVVHRNLI